MKNVAKTKNGHRLLFLDIDGVLNCRSTTDKCGPYRGIEKGKTLLLKSIIAATGAQIVLISSWKEQWYSQMKDKPKQDELACYLDDKLAEVGLKIWSKNRLDIFYDRGKAILAYLEKLRNKGITIRDFVIIDDEEKDYKQVGLSSRWVQTDFEGEGLNEACAKRAIGILLASNHQ